MSQSQVKCKSYLWLLLLLQSSSYLVSTSSASTSKQNKKNSRNKGHDYMQNIWPILQTTLVPFKNKSVAYRVVHDPQSNTLQLSVSQHHSKPFFVFVRIYIITASWERNCLDLSHIWYTIGLAVIVFMTFYCTESNVQDLGV